MNEILSWQNGEWIPNSKVGCSLFDSHYMLGCAVFDAMRTYNHKVFRLEQHLNRFYGSMSACGYQPHYDFNQLKDIILETMDVNQEFFPNNEEYRFMIYYSPGTFDIYKDMHDTGPVITLNVTQCSRYAPFVAPYLDKGIDGRVSEIMQIPNRFINAKVKHCSRIHYYMAEQECGDGCMPILLDERGYLSESAGANIGFFVGDELFLPIWDNVLRGQTMLSCVDLLQKKGVKINNGFWDIYDLMSADSIFFTSTFRGVIPCYELFYHNRGYSLHNMYDSVNKLIDLFNKEVGLDTRVQWENWHETLKKLN